MSDSSDQIESRSPQFKYTYWLAELRRNVCLYWHIWFFLSNEYAKTQYIDKTEHEQSEYEQELQITVAQYIESQVSEETAEFMEEPSSEEDGEYLNALSELNEADIEHPVFSEEPKEPNHWEQEHLVNLTKDEIKSNLTEAPLIYNRQMIVLTVTYIEVLISNFVGAVIWSDPSRGPKGSEDKSTKKKVGMLKKKVPEVELSKSLDKNLDRFIKLRNRIVHEASLEPVRERLKSQTAANLSMRRMLAI